MMQETFMTNLMYSLKLAMEEGNLSPNTLRIIKNRIKEPLEEYINLKEAALKEAELIEEQCLQNDDGFSKETEAAMQQTETLMHQVKTAKEVKELLPTDIVVQYYTKSGVHYDVF